MTIEAILEALDTEIARLEQVKKVLTNNSNLAAGRLGGRAGKTAAKRAGRKRRKLSPEARQKIADAQRKRWAAHRKAAK